MLVLVLVQAEEDAEAEASLAGGAGAGDVDAAAAAGPEGDFVRAFLCERDEEEYEGLVGAMAGRRLLARKEDSVALSKARPAPSPSPISPNFPVLSRACLCCLGAPIWVLTSLRA